MIKSFLNLPGQFRFGRERVLFELNATAAAAGADEW